MSVTITTRNTTIPTSVPAIVAVRSVVEFSFVGFSIVGVGVVVVRGVVSSAVV